MIAVELCSLTLQRTDESAANLTASALFSDGAVAVVLSGDGDCGRATPRAIASRSVPYSGTEGVLGVRFLP